MAVVLIVLAVGAFVVYVALGWRADAHLDGMLARVAVRAPVTILRDERGIPHIRAGSVRDAVVAQGYVEGSDRLFQMDLIRHHVYGRVAEWFGRAALAHDVRAREFDIARVVEREYAALSSEQREIVDAFSDGVNAAMQQEPLPVEYRLLLLRPQSWRPQDALAAGFATVLDLTDDWYDVLERNRVFRRLGPRGLEALYPITDPRYDAPTTGAASARVAPLPALPPRPAAPRLAPARENPKEGTGSNDWAAGAALTRAGRALLADDPHLAVAIPGIWYLVDLAAPGLHVAGASLTGTPGVILGHNERVAWGVTNATVVSESVYAAGDPAFTRRERFAVRFAGTVEHEYKADPHGFIIRSTLEPGVSYSVDWEPSRSAIAPLSAFIGLDRAASIEDAVRALRGYPGPPQSFVLADVSGRAAYELAGDVPDDPFWGLRVHAASAPHYANVPFDRLPRVAASRKALVFSANDRVYGKGYAYRLSPGFAPPYRAARIRDLLRAHKPYSVEDFAAIQRDTLSYPERELAQDALSAASRTGAAREPKLAASIAELSRWDGRFDPESRGASLAFALRVAALGRFTGGFFSKEEAKAYASSANGQLVALLRALRERPRGYVARDDYDALLVDALRDAVRAPHAGEPWKLAGAVAVRHPLAALGIGWFDGVTLPGVGDAYVVHVQKASGAQSFRAVWDVGNWDAGGIVIPSGESGRPGSPHYKDLAPTWREQTLVPLPFSRAAVDAATRHRLVLTP